MFNIPHSPWGVDPDDANVAEKNALFVFLVLAGAAFLSPVGRVGELRQGALIHHRGARNREGRGWGKQVRGHLETETLSCLVLIIIHSFTFVRINRGFERSHFTKAGKIKLNVFTEDSD